VNKKEGRQIGGENGASGISRLLGAAKLQSSLSADNPRYVTGSGFHTSCY